MNLRLLILVLLSGVAFTAATLAVVPADSQAAVTVTFTPDCGKMLLQKLRDARKEIKIAIFELTKRDVVDVLIDRAQHHVNVSVKIDAHEAEFQYTEELLARMQQAKITIERIKMPGNVKMHNKFAVIDGQCVITGSYNWTKRATEENWENLVALESLPAAQRYLAEWQRIKSVR